MDNETIFAEKENSDITEMNIATVSAIISDNWFYWKWNDAIINLFENSTNSKLTNSNVRDGINHMPSITSTNTTFQNFYNTFNDWNIFEEISLFIWILIGTGTTLIIVVISYLAFRRKNLGKKINGTSQQITDSSDNISEFMWPRWMFCCPKSIFDKQENLRMIRQNSASNLDPYRRPPLPFMDYNEISEDEIHSNILLTHRLESSNMTESHLSAATIKSERLSMLASETRNGSGSNLFAINITDIRRMPIISPIKNDRRSSCRPQFSGCFNNL